MVYNLIVTEKAEELLDQLIYHLVFRLKNDQAASHLFDSIEMIYDRLEENPYQFPESRDTNLKRLGYREAIVTGMNYVIVYRVEKHSIYVVGVFHQLEDYRKKV